MDGYLGTAHGEDKQFFVLLGTAGNGYNQLVNRYMDVWINSWIDRWMDTWAPLTVKINSFSCYWAPLTQPYQEARRRHPLFFQNLSAPT